jgi:galactokinase
MSAEGASRADDAFAKAQAAWDVLDPAHPARWLFVPGRIEVLGKHTDYAGGTTLTCAIERGFCVLYSPSRHRTIRMVDAGRRQQTRFEIGPELQIAAGRWPAFPMTVARRLARNFGGELAGADIAFLSTLPGCAGMSSSSALITATCLVLADANRLSARPEYRANIRDRAGLAGYLGSIENGSAFGALAGDRGVGTFGGSEDHAAILCSRPGHAGVFEFCPVRGAGYLPVPVDCTFVLAASGIIADKTGNARDDYNRASAQVAEILRRWRAATGRSDDTLRAAVRSSGDALERLRAVLQLGDNGSQALAHRLQHFIVENERLVPAAIAALKAQDTGAFGEIVDESQRAAEDLLGNQVPETIALARSARGLGAIAASSFGAGFGGSVWALVRTADAPRFAEDWRAEYARTASASALDGSVFFLTQAGPAAMGSDIQPETRSEN